MAAAGVFMGGTIMRYIDFTLDGSSTNILVHMEEQSDGTIAVTLTAEGHKADIRGLFFDFNHASLLSSLSVNGSDITGFQARDEGVMNLGRGAEMNGEGRGPFDVGIAFGSPGGGHDIVSTTSFTLSSSSGAITLDELALVDFGVRLQGGGVPPKIVEIAPAAPDAHDDALTATEDTTIVYHVLDNDTDADGTADFQILSVTDPDHGTATISADGKTIVYTPDLNYSGDDGFDYAMTDGHGGGDSAHAAIGVIAVADAPTLSVTTAAGANVDEIVINVTSSVTDTDGSEYIDRLEFSGLPSGASIVGESDLVYNPSTTGGTMTQSFTLQLAHGTDFDFDLGVTAVSKELSNGSEASTTVDTPILSESNSNEFALDFHATDQSIWSSGDAFQLIDDRFIGFTVDPPEASTGGLINAYADLYLHSGFQSTLTFDGGSIDASAPWDVDIDTTYNHTTDTLLIHSTADLDSENVNFQTSGPNGSYVLDFIFDYAIKAGLQLDLGDVLGSYDLASFNVSGNNTVNILDVSSNDLSLEFDFPFGLSITLAWPDVDTSSLVSSDNTFASSGESNNFFDLGVDVDQALADILFDGVNPFSYSVDIDVAWGTADLLDVDLDAGMNFLQEFVMNLGGLDGTLTFENGATQNWDFSDIALSNASSYDSDHDGIIEFDLTLDQQATLENQTDLGFNMGYSVDLLKASGGYDVVVDSGDWSVGPVWHTGDSVDLGSINLYDSTFGLNFAAQTIHFTGNEMGIV
jgi:hypothetical protein